MTSSSDISKDESQPKDKSQLEGESQPEAGGQPKKRPPRFTLRPVITPLPSQAKAAGGTGELTNSGNAKGEAEDAGITGKAPAVADAALKPGAPKSAGPKSGAPAAILRGENEDDDGYDPYSDYHDGTARTLQFERDPWN